jgi:hypothetical protein
MEQNILIISFNNLGQTFWDNQLDTKNSIVWLIKKPASIASCLKRFNPDIVIIDTYFSQKEDNENVLKCFQELKKVAFEKLVFHFSPHFSEKGSAPLSLNGMFQTTLCNRATNQINQLMSSDYLNNLTA